MTSPPFTVGLRLSLEVTRDDASAGQAHSVVDWRHRLTPIDQCEVRSIRFPPDAVPSEQDALNELGLTFAEHPMVNSGLRLEPGGSVGPPLGAKDHAYVIAEIALLPDLAEIPPGGEFPDVTDEIVGSGLLVHHTSWAHRPGPDATSAAQELLQEIVGDLPVDRWTRHA